MNKKICFVVSSEMTVRVFLQDHIAALSEDYDIYLVGNFTAADIKSFSNLNLSGIKSVAINRNVHLFHDIVSVFKLRRFLRAEKFFATHSVTPKAGLICAISSFLAQTPNRIHIFTGQVWHTKSGFIKWLLKSLDKITSTLNTNILVDGESQRQFLINNKIIKENSSFVLGKGSISGVNVQRFNPESSERLKYRKKLNLNEKIVFGFLGRLNRDKGILDLFEAFNKLTVEFDNTFLLLIGYDEEGMIPLLPKYSNINSRNYFFWGPSQEPEKILQAIDVFCLPSYREGFGTSVLEASCLGIPAICSDTYGLMDSIIEGATGLRHKTGQSHDLYLKMKEMAENETLRIELGKNAREYVIQNFSGEVITKEWRKFYKQLAINVSKVQ